MKQTTRKITYQDAINEALIQEMRRDKNVFLYGIDVADHKRTFDTGKNILELFGPKRCFSTPLAEDSLLGFGIGAAINGLRPVNVHIRIDFLLLAMNQLINIASSFRYGSGGVFSVPLTIRAIIGRGWGQGFQHSKTMQSIFAHVPGLKVIMPTTPSDAKGMLVAAIRDNNPVIVLEHRWLYYQTGDVAKELYETEIGKANILRKGKDLTIVATSWMNVEAKEAADILKERGISAEIVDPRTIFPLDEKTIAQSVKKTGRCLVADCDWLYCGFSAEVAAMVSQKCFNALKAPVERVGFARTPCPTVRILENEFFPNAFNIVRAAEKILKLKPMDLSSRTLYSYENKFKGPF